VGGGKRTSGAAPEALGERWKALETVVTGI
jgi:hypothetical protein